MTMHRIAEAIVAEIAAARVTPSVFLVEGNGTIILSPHEGVARLPSAAELLFRMYLAPGTPAPKPLAETITVRGAPTVVRIVPYASDGSTRYAVVLEPFATRSRPHAEPNALIPAT